MSQGERELEAAEKDLQEAALKYATLKYRLQGNEALGMVMITKEQARELRQLFRKAEHYRAGWNRINLRTPQLERLRNLSFIGLEADTDEEDD